jgi:hypothetical protein
MLEVHHQEQGNLFLMEKKQQKKQTKKTRILLFVLFSF